MKKTSLRIFLIISIILFIAISAVYIYISNMIHENTEIAIQSKQIVLRHQDEATHVKSLEDTLNKSREQRIEIDKFFLPEDDLVSFIELLERTTATAGLKMEVKNVSNVAGTLESKGIGKLKVTITLGGSWQKINSYISLIEKIPYKISIPKIELLRVTDTGSRVNNPEWISGLQIEVTTLLKEYFVIKK